MARGKRISEQRKSARRTIRDRRQGRDKSSEGSSFSKSGGGAQRAAENRAAARARDKKIETERTKSRKLLSEGVPPEVQKANLEAFQKGFTEETTTEAFGDLAGAVTGGLGKAAVEAVSSAADALGSPEESESFQRQGFSRFGAQVAEDIGPTKSGLVNKGLDLAASTNPGAGIAKAALDFKKRSETTITGPGGVESPAFTGEAGAGAGGRQGEDRGSISNEDIALTPSPVPPTTSIAPRTPEITVTPASPGIGISSGTDERVPNFAGSIVVSGRKSRKRRGIT